MSQSDRDILRAMFDGAGIVYQEDGDELRVIAKRGPNNEGYGDFFTTFDFTEHGALIKIGGWE